MNNIIHNNKIIMNEISARDPGLINQVTSLIEKGLTPIDIAKTLISDNEKRELLKTGDIYDSDEEFPDEIRLIAQALCYRNGTIDDIDDIKKLLNNAYKYELLNNSNGKYKEGFRIDKEGITIDLITQLFEQSSYKWLIVEAPNGHNIENDGVMLGACCYSTDGISRKNGEIEGNLGSIRLFGVLPRYHGLFIGLRMLKRVESEMYKMNCCRAMVCIPSIRLSLMNWIERKGYIKTGAHPYPAKALGHEVVIEQLQLVVYLKALDNECNELADSKEKEKPILYLNNKAPNVTTTILHNGNDEVYNDDNSVHNNDNNDDEMDDENKQQLLPQVPGKMNLPPHWRMSNLQISSKLDDEADSKSKPDIPDVD